MASNGALDAISKRGTGILTHRLPLTEIKTAFQVAVAGSGLKVIVEPHAS